MAGGSVCSPLVGCLSALSTRLDRLRTHRRQHLLKGGAISGFGAKTGSLACRSPLSAGGLAVLPMDNVELDSEA